MPIVDRINQTAPEPMTLAESVESVTKEMMTDHLCSVTDEADPKEKLVSDLVLPSV